MNFLFGFSGRMGRGEWWLGQLFVLFLTIVAAVVAVISLGPNVPRSAFKSVELLRYMSTSAVMAIFCLAVLAIWVNIAVTIKRFHDRGKPGVWFLVMFVPYIGSLWQLIECGFLRGTDCRNDYDTPSGGHPASEGRQVARVFTQPNSVSREPGIAGPTVPATSRRPTGPTGFGKRT